MLQRSRLFLVVLAIFRLVLRAIYDAAAVVALGASNTFGKGVSPGKSYPAQLEAMCRPRASMPRSSTPASMAAPEGMLAQLDSAVPRGASVVILQPGGTT